MRRSPRWWSPGIGITIAVLLGLLSLGLIGVATDRSVAAAGRAAAAAVAALAAALVLRSLQAGVRVNGDTIEIHRLFETRRVTADDYADVVVEELGQRWGRLGVLRHDGSVVSAPWATWRLTDPRLIRAVDDVRSSFARPRLPVQPLERLVAATLHETTVVGRPGSAPGAEEPAADNVPDRLDPTFPLDRAVGAGLDVAWGLGEVLKAVVVFVALLAAWSAVVALTDLPGSVASFVGEGLIGVAAVLGGRKAVRGAGGVAAAFGSVRPTLRDVPLALRWTGWQFLAGFVTVLLLQALVPGVRDTHVSNTGRLHDESAWALAVIVIAAVLLAPVVEELFFRGLFLRATMRRLSFWPSAFINAALFGAAHAPQGDSGTAALVLATTIGVFGLLQCMLVRRTGRLGPAVIVHGLHNGITVLIALM